jgi:hypothetical protein
MKRMLAVVLLLTGGAVSAAGFDASKVKYTETRVDVDTPEKGSKGFIRIIGEFHNGTDQWLWNLCVDVEYLDAAGKPIPVKSISTLTRAELGKGSSDRICAAQQYVAPGATVVFKKLRDQKYLQRPYASHRVGTPTARPVAEPPSLVIEGFEYKKEEMKKWASFTLSGQLKNTGKLKCHFPEIVLGLYTADKKLYGVEGAQVASKSLAPGESVAFHRKSVPDPEKVVTEVRAFPNCMDLKK